MERPEIRLPAFIPVLPARGSATIVVSPLKCDDDQLHRFTTLLSRDELARYERFLIPKVANRFAQCRGTLRILLSGMLAIPAEQIEFQYNGLGKPRLSGVAARSHLEFNVSHCEDWAAFVFSVDSPVGIDVELYQRRANYEAIASQLLTQSEMQMLAKLPIADRDRHILRAWVAKESLLKAIGVGIGVGLHSVELPLPLDSSCNPINLDPGLLEQIDDDGNCRMTSWIDKSTWRLQLLDIIPQGVVALACHAKNRQINACTV
jgi:4'-phosphopantetheinyl transferase